MRWKVFLSCVTLTLAGCMVGPNYQRPTVAAPPAFRAGEPQPSQASLGDARWFDLFQDDTLRGLIQESLQANYDIKIAAQRVIEAQGQLTVTRSGLFPQLDGQAEAGRNGTKSPIQSWAAGFGSVSWEIDLFGKLRRATEAARADMLSVQENQKAVMQALVADVASAYFALREIDAELEYVRESVKTRQQSVTLVAARMEGGVGNELDLDQAKTLVQSAQAELALLERAQEQTENLINYLLGKQPGAVARGKSLIEQSQPPQVPSGLPSTLLERRPDLREAEQQLIAANARVGVAKAAFYPSINLTAAGGYQSTDLLGIASRTGFAYSMGGVVDLPIFDAGRRSGNYKIAKAQREEILIGYQKAIHGAFRDVSDALAGYQKTREYSSSQKLLAETLRDQSGLATKRYEGGVSSYLEVLDTERQRLTAEQTLAQSQRDVLTSLVQLYKALGGGWQ
ncbi:RND efflux system, outer membrane lipoprotein, NodT [Candidatus Sulfopaludibacter sp. SbA3]|nr:RND efflux system, outer membrane lipoprotein, NodT [Candidatus Sulfopaludibacter sp. SbA3]